MSFSVDGMYNGGNQSTADGYDGNNYGQSSGQPPAVYGYPYPPAVGSVSDDPTHSINAVDGHPVVIGLPVETAPIARLRDACEIRCNDFKLKINCKKYDVTMRGSEASIQCKCRWNSVLPIGKFCVANALILSNQPEAA
ncbi:hypothetical protein niasHT_003230 [Heterodera trifolii]|uniref:Uncharacterized protein n=1 Tax=Heterodera trifolii TaxID=157864 RepID=A0ABD2MAG0_9BILA